MTYSFKDSRDFSKLELPEINENQNKIEAPESLSLKIRCHEPLDYNSSPNPFLEPVLIRSKTIENKNNHKSSKNKVDTVNSSGKNIVPIPKKIMTLKINNEKQKTFLSTLRSNTIREEQSSKPIIVKDIQQSINDIKLIELKENEEISKDIYSSPKNKGTCCTNSFSCFII